MYYSYKNKVFNISECKEGYISPYSKFMIDNYPLNFNSSDTLCDYGAGTGILGIIASLYNFQKIISIENNNQCYKLLLENYKKNNIKTKTYFFKNATKCKEKFNSIICNPASLPNFINANSFCDGGTLGIDMILNVLKFANYQLTNSGHLYIIVTSILPYNLIIEKISNYNLNFRIISKKIIPFRDHYNGINTWVDNLKSIHNEMYYIKDSGIFYEELMLWKIWRK